MGVDLAFLMSSVLVCLAVIFSSLSDPTLMNTSNRRKTRRKKASDKPIILLFNKPFQVLCQFSSADHGSTLKDYVLVPNVYPAGRLDKDSEGLVLLTNHGPWQHALSHPDTHCWKTYWVQVEGQLTASALTQLQQGVPLKMV